MTASLGRTTAAARMSLMLRLLTHRRPRPSHRGTTTDSLASEVHVTVCSGRRALATMPKLGSKLLLISRRRRSWCRANGGIVRIGVPLNLLSWSLTTDAAVEASLA